MKPKCKLTGTDGNVFSLGSKVSAALRKAGLSDQVSEFQKKLFQCPSYDAALILMSEYVDIE